MHVVGLVLEGGEGTKGGAHAPVAVAERRPVVQVEAHKLLEINLRDRAPKVYLELRFYYQVLNL